MKFFFDNNLAPRLAAAMQALMGDKHEAVHLKEKFLPNTPDVDWLARLGSEGGWVIICGDPKILRKPHEQKALQEAKLLAYFLKPGWINLEFWLQAYKLVQWWPVIMETSERVAPPAFFSVPTNYNGKLLQERLK